MALHPLPDETSLLPVAASLPVVIKLRGNCRGRGNESVFPLPGEEGLGTVPGRGGVSAQCCSPWPSPGSVCGRSQRAPPGSQRPVGGLGGSSLGGGEGWGQLPERVEGWGGSSLGEGVGGQASGRREHRVGGCSELGGSASPSMWDEVEGPGNPQTPLTWAVPQPL